MKPAGEGGLRTEAAVWAKAMRQDVVPGGAKMNCNAVPPGAVIQDRG